MLTIIIGPNRNAPKVPKVDSASIIVIMHTQRDPILINDNNIILSLHPRFKSKSVVMPIVYMVIFTFN